MMIVELHALHSHHMSWTGCQPVDNPVCMAVVFAHEALSSLAYTHVHSA
jgi:hypothetical protein